MAQERRTTRGFPKEEHKDMVRKTDSECSLPLFMRLGRGQSRMNDEGTAPLTKGCLRYRATRPCVLQDHTTWARALGRYVAAGATVMGGRLTRPPHNPSATWQTNRFVSH